MQCPRKSHTFIAVTREEDVACHARRILRIRDGLIASDEKWADYNSFALSATAFVKPAKRPTPDPSHEGNCNKRAMASSPPGRGQGWVRASCLPATRHSSRATSP
jgi:hypothetical protein